jgi:hypothetical protein
MSRTSAFCHRVCALCTSLQLFSLSPHASANFASIRAVDSRFASTSFRFASTNARSELLFLLNITFMNDFSHILLGQMSAR